MLTRFIRLLQFTTRFETLKSGKRKRTETAAALGYPLQTRYDLSDFDRPSANRNRRNAVKTEINVCSWPSFDVSRGGSGADTDLEQSLARAEKRCALNSHFQNHTRWRLNPCCSGFLPDGDGQFRRE